MQIYQKSILARCPPSPKHPPRCPIPTIFGTCLPIGCASSGLRRGGRKSGLRWSATWTGRMCQRWNDPAGMCRCRTSSALRRRWMWSLGCCSGRRTGASELRQSNTALTGMFQRFPRSFAADLCGICRQGNGLASRLGTGCPRIVNAVV